MINYFIKDGDKELGPFSMAQLEGKSLREDTLIWHAGLKEWIEASGIFGLNPLFKKKRSITANTNKIIITGLKHIKFNQPIKKVS